MAAVGVPCVTIFQKARDKIKSDINNVIQCLNNKQVEMFAEISRLEKEFQDKQQQKYKDLNKLSSVKARTEEELGENSLREVQQRVVRELQIGIDKLTLHIENTREPDFKIEIKWGMCMSTLFTQINESHINVTQLIPPAHDIQPILPNMKGSRKWKQRVAKETTGLRFQFNERAPIGWKDRSWNEYSCENETSESVSISRDDVDYWD